MAKQTLFPQSSCINLRYRGKERLRYNKESKGAEYKTCANYSQKKQKCTEKTGKK